MVSECVGGVIGNQGTRNQHSVTDSGGRTACANLEYLAVELLGLLRLEGHAQQNEGDRQALHTNADRAVPHVRSARCLHRIVIDVDNTLRCGGGSQRDDRSHALKRIRTFRLRVTTRAISKSL